MTIGIGVLGSGFMGRTWAEVAFNHAHGTHLVAVAGGRRAPALAQDYGVPLEPTFEALLARRDVDAVVITTPPLGHGDESVLASQAGSTSSSKSRWPCRWPNATSWWLWPKNTIWSSPSATSYASLLCGVE